ncbi:DUF397 domain-containing protein [Streptomyces sp. NPDC090994]|uniref:DUF397 domain-containing protein n=1 Tax=Streptomyces sp. NPDC090994 TaxID=3365969 RepID=UPI00380F064A
MNNTETSTTTALGLAWCKSSYSGTEGGQCVEIAAGTTAIHIRDSKNATGPVLTLSSGAWAGFVKSV